MTKSSNAKLKRRQLVKKHRVQTRPAKPAKLYKVGHTITHNNLRYTVKTRKSGNSNRRQKYWSALRGGGRVLNVDKYRAIIRMHGATWVVQLDNNNMPTLVTWRRGDVPQMTDPYYYVDHRSTFPAQGFENTKFARATSRPTRDEIRHWLRVDESDDDDGDDYVG